MSLRLDRLLSIVIKLLTYRRVTTQQLAQEFGVSSRTIYRDLQTISLSGVPVISYQGQQGGWELDPDYLIDRRVLSVEDLANIVSALQSINNGVSQDSLAKTLDKINSMILPQKQPEINTKLNHIVIDYHPLFSSHHSQDRVDTIHTGITESRCLTFRYHNLKQEVRDRTIEPMTLLLKGSSWYLFGYCFSRHDYRLFRLSRMSNLSLLPDHFERRDATVNCMHNFAEKPEELTQLSLTFHTDILFKISDAFGLDTINIDGDYGTIDVSLPDNDWLYGFLLGFGEKLKVNSPSHIANRLKKMAQTIQEHY